MNAAGFAVLYEVGTERDIQRRTWGDEHDDTAHQQLRSWLWLFNERIDKIRAADSRAEQRHQLVVLAALAVAAVETIDRHGVKK